MPIYERRFYLGLLTKKNLEEEERLEKLKQEMNNKGSKGSRSKTISGDALKTKLKTGEVPLN